MKPAPHLAAGRLKGFERRIRRQRARIEAAVRAAEVVACSYCGGGVCGLDARRHYHLVLRSGQVRVVEYGSEEDLQRAARYEQFSAARPDVVELPDVFGIFGCGTGGGAVRG